MSIGAKIQEYSSKIKYLFESRAGEWGVPILLVLLSVASFGLGRLSVLETSREAVSIGHAPIIAEPRGMYPGGAYVASRTGSAYYFPWCAGAAKILPQNMRWFPDESSAKAAGYAPAKNCKGLE
jgi:hypothetical protein